MQLNWPQCTADVSKKKKKTIWYRVSTPRKLQKGARTVSRFTYKDIPDFYQSWKHKEETPGKDVPKI